MFVAYPFARGIYISLCKWNGYSQNIRFIGIGNYGKIFTDNFFRISFFNSVLYGFTTAIIQSVAGLLFALLVDSRFKGNGFLRTVIYLPIMIAALIMGYIMTYFFDYSNGVFNDILSFFGHGPINWLADKRWGKTAIILVTSWHYAGQAMLIYLAGLQSIPTSYYEAARIDGASPFKLLRYITIPMLIPSIQSAFTLNLIGGFKLFDSIVSLTGGGPNFSTGSLMTYVNDQYFNKQNAGYASAIGLFTFLIILIVSTILNTYFAKKEVDL